MDARVSQYVHLALEKLLEFLVKAHEIQERSVVVHFDQQINVAIEPVFTSRDRTKHADVPRAVAGGDAEDLFAISFDGQGVRQPAERAARVFFLGWQE